MNKILEYKMFNTPEDAKIFSMAMGLRECPEIIHKGIGRFLWCVWYEVSKGVN